MPKLTKQGMNSLNKMLNSFSVIDYHKTLLKAIKHDSEKNNLQKVSQDIFKLLYNEYKNVLNL